MHATEEEIADFVLGDAEPEVSDHIAACATCREQEEELRTILDLVMSEVPEMPGDLAGVVWERLEPRLSRRPPDRRWWSWALGAAAVLALAVISGTITRRILQPRANKPAAIPRIVRKPLSNVTTPVAPAPATAVPRVATQKIRVPPPASRIEAPPRIASTDALHLPSEMPLVVAAPTELPGVAPISLNPPGVKFDREKWLAERNFFIDQAERLPGNVGYLRLTAFYRADMSSGALAAAMNFLSHTDALIVDLRQTRGDGDEAMMRMFIDYFRQEGEAPAAGQYMNRDVFVLTSQYDSCAPEAIAGDLQVLRHATVVGQKPSGLFSPKIAIGGAPNAIPCPTGFVNDWKNIGLIPNIDATDEGALDVAYTEALERLIAANPKSDLMEERYRALENVQKNLRNRDTRK